MEADPSNQPDIAHQNVNNVNQFQEISNEKFRVQLANNQCSFLTSLLPKGYSFEPESKLVKRQTSTSKSTKEDLNSLSKTRKSTGKDYSEAPLSKKGSTKSKGGKSKIVEESQNAIYEKYSNSNNNINSLNAKKTNFEVAESVKHCVKILYMLKTSKTSWPFREPVDAIALGIPHYLEVVKEPMDLSTMQENLRTNQYETPTQFYADISKIIRNSYAFNSTNVEYTKYTRQFEEYYLKITAEPSIEYTRSYSHVEKETNQRMEDKAYMAQPKKKIKRQTEHSDQFEPISINEKKELSISIKKLPREYMKGIVLIVNEGKQKVTGEFDLKELQPKIIRKLQQYVKEKLAQVEKNNGNHEGNGIKNQIDQRQQQESSFELDEDED